MNKTVYMQSAPALGSNIELRLVASNAQEAGRLFAVLWKSIEEFENRFSRFKAESELSLFNTHAGAQVQISSEFKTLLEKARYFSVLTRGVFNPFVLPALQRAGYGSSLVDITAEAPDYSGREMVEYERLEIGDTWARIPAHSAIDLGGIGKGYLADELAALISPYTQDYCISLGGDMRVGGEQPSGPWVIDVQAADNLTKNSGAYSDTRSSFGIATSGPVRTTAYKTQPHLIDPRTGQALSYGSGLCTVVAEDGVTADVLASCILIEGAELAHQMIDDGHVRAVLVQKNNDSAPLVLGKGFTLYA